MRATVAIDTSRGTFNWFHFTAQQLTAAGGVEGVQARLRRQGYSLKWEPSFKNPEKWAAIYRKAEAR